MAAADETPCVEPGNAEGGDSRTESLAPPGQNETNAEEAGEEHQRADLARGRRTGWLCQAEHNETEDDEAGDATGPAKRAREDHASIYPSSRGALHQRLAMPRAQYGPISGDLGHQPRMGEQNHQRRLRHQPF